MTSQVTDLSSLHKCRTEIPNIIDDLNLDPYEFRVYMKYKRIAGDGGACWKSNAAIADECHISTRTLQRVKKQLASPYEELNGLPLIKIEHRKTEEGDPDTDLITIVDLWPLNFKKYYGGGDSQSPGVVTHSHQGGDSQSPKEDPSKEDHKEHVPPNPPNPPNLEKETLSEKKERGEGSCPLREKRTERAKAAPKKKSPCLNVYDATSRYKLTESQGECLIWLVSLKLGTNIDSLAYWAKTQQRANLEVLYAKAKDKRCPGKYMRKLINSNVEMATEHSTTNKETATLFQKVYGKTRLIIKELYAIIINDNGVEKEASYSLPKETFIDILEKNLGYISNA